MYKYRAKKISISGHERIGSDAALQTEDHQVN